MMQRQERTRQLLELQRSVRMEMWSSACGDGAARIRYSAVSAQPDIIRRSSADNEMETNKKTLFIQFFMNNVAVKFSD